MLLAVIMIIGAFTALTSCGGGKGGGGGDSDPCAEGHTYNAKTGRCTVCKVKCTHDYKDDNVCDICGYTKKDTETGGGDDYPEVPWADDDPIELFFMMSDNSSGESLPSGCNRYLAGGDQRLEEAIDIDVEERNASAEYLTNVKLKYDYYPEASDYGWGKCYELISSTIGTTGCPDMFCNFTYDMVAASLRGSFANLRDQDLDEGNFFSFLDEDYDEEEDNRGYMHEYMESVTLSKHKMYVLASDYFTDLIRAFFIIPISISLIESVGPTVTGERDGVDGWTVDDFYAQVWDMEWNYDLMMKYSAAVYQDDGDNATTDPWLGDTVGFGYSTKGVAACGLLFTTSVVLIEKQFNEELNDYEYFFPKTNDKLYEFVDAAKELLNSKGVVRVGNVTSGAYSIKKWGEDGLRAVRTRFSQNKVLFGDIMMIGALEYDAYQSMKNPDGTGGFGLVCVPLYTDVEGERYLTQIHNVGRPGAIGANTLKFAECTAFLNYQSTHSTDILDNYYNFKLMYDIAGGAEGTVDMLRYIRLNVRTSFDKAFEDALGVFHGKEAGYNNKLLVIISGAAFDIDIRTEYDRILELKNNQLNTLEEYYLTYPN